MKSLSFTKLDIHWGYSEILCGTKIQSRCLLYCISLSGSQFEDLEEYLASLWDNVGEVDSPEPTEMLRVITRFYLVNLSGYFIPVVLFGRSTYRGVPFHTINLYRGSPSIIYVLLVIITECVCCRL